MPSPTISTSAARRGGRHRPGTVRASSLRVRPAPCRRRHGRGMCGEDRQRRFVARPASRVPPCRARYRPRGASACHGNAAPTLTVDEDHATRGKSRQECRRRERLPARIKGQGDGAPFGVMPIRLIICGGPAAWAAPAQRPIVAPQATFLECPDHVTLVAAGMAMYENLPVCILDRKAWFAVVVGRASRHPALPDFPPTQRSCDGLSGHCAPPSRWKLRGAPRPASPGAPTRPGRDPNSAILVSRPVSMRRASSHTSRSEPL